MRFVIDVNVSNMSPDRYQEVIEEVAYELDGYGIRDWQITRVSTMRIKHINTNKETDND